MAGYLPLPLDYEALEIAQEWADNKPAQVSEIPDLGGL